MYIRVSVTWRTINLLIRWWTGQVMLIQRRTNAMSSLLRFLYFSVNNTHRRLLHLTSTVCSAFSSTGRLLGINTTCCLWLAVYTYFKGYWISNRSSHLLLLVMDWEWSFRRKSLRALEECFTLEDYLRKKEKPGLKWHPTCALVFSSCTN